MLEAQTSFSALEQGLQLVYEAHYLLDHADQELSLLVKKVYEVGSAVGGIHHGATFIAPGPSTALRAAVALLDGLNVCSTFQAHYWNLFDVLFAKHSARENVLWAIDNGRQAWCIGYMSPRKVTHELVLEVREDVSQSSLERFQTHVQEENVSEKVWETNLFWRHSPVEDVLAVLKRFALCVLYEEVMLDRKMQGAKEKVVHVG